MKPIIYHNPDNLPTAGDPPWRFLVEGERVSDELEPDEWWHTTSQAWAEIIPGCLARHDAHPTTTYRTKRPLPLPTPQPGGGGEGKCILHPKQSEPCDICEREEREHIEKFGTNAIPPTPPIALPVRAEGEGAVIHRLTHTEPKGWPDQEMMEQAWAEEDAEQKATATAQAKAIVAWLRECGNGRSADFVDQTFAALSALSRELEESRAEKRAVIEMLNRTADAGGFDRYDEGIELSRMVESFHNRMWDYWRKKHDEIAGGAEVTQRIETLETEKARAQASFIKASAELEEAKAERDSVRMVANEERGKLIKERDKAREAKRPFSDVLAQKVIDGQVKELDRLRAELTALRAAPRSEGAVSEADIEKAARFFANAYIRGFRGASSLAKATSVDEWVAANWESFCTEATEFLAALAPRSETEGRDKALLDGLEKLASETECGVQVCCDNLTDPKKPAWWIEVEGQIVPVHLKEYAGNLRDAIAAALAHDEKGAGE